MYGIMYLLFVVSIIFGSSIYVGPATPRQYMAVIMCCYCFYKYRPIKSTIGKWLNPYMLFIFFFGICAVIDQNFDFFIRELISKYMVAVVMFISTILYIRDKYNLNRLCAVLTFAGILNGMVCFLQYLRHPIGIILGGFFMANESEHMMSMFQRIETGDSGSYLFGMLGHPVLNGYFMMSIPFFIFFFLTDAKTLFSKIIIALTLVFSLVILFLIQQRSAFLISFLGCGYLFTKKIKLKNNLFLIFVLIVILISILPDLLSSSAFQESRLMTNKEDVRGEIYANALSYLLSHFLFGGINGFMANSAAMPHNLILNSFLYGGFFGGIVILRLAFKQVKLAWSFRKTEYICAVSLAFISYTMNGFLHNSSIVTGDAFLWMLFGILVGVLYNFKCSGYH